MSQRTRLFVTRGLPGSGKTTAATKMVNDAITRDTDGKVKAVKLSRINRDSFRAMMHGSRLGAGQQEQLVTIAQHAAVRALLLNGKDVVVDDTNLRDSQIREFKRIADECCADLFVIDLRAVPLEECIERDAARQGAASVGEKVIRGMHNEHIAKGIAAAAVAATARSLRATR